MLKVGLTGGIASGKSVVGEMFVALGAHLVQADRIAHSLMQPGEAVYNDVVRHFVVILERHRRARLDRQGRRREGEFLHRDVGVVGPSRDDLAQEKRERGRRNPAYSGADGEITEARARRDCVLAEAARHVVSPCSGEGPSKTRTQERAVLFPGL